MIIKFVKFSLIDIKSLKIPTNLNKHSLEKENIVFFLEKHFTNFTKFSITHLGTNTEET